ncbi:MAG: hypothetical protein EA349_11580 [Halomonadaceae bacterium]|nr:MAG: hypothetical protein EA349_11580 [Halomonadaceae bacterium]
MGPQSLIQDRSPVSLTGHYTGQVWVRHGLAPKALATARGRLLYRALQPLERSASKLAGISLEASLVQRHRLLDQLVSEAIGVEPGLQILEIAAGASARASRVLGEHQGKALNYTEADLPAVVNHKAQLLPALGLQQETRHRLLPVNIQRSEGPLSPEALLADLDSQRPVLVITEGLLNYFPLSTVLSFMERLVKALSAFPEGRYLADIWPRLPQYPGATGRKAMVALIESVTRQKVPLHFNDARDMTSAVLGTGFNQIRVIDPDDFRFHKSVPVMRRPALFRILDARVTGQG